MCSSDLYQMVTGTLRVNGTALTIANGRLRADQLAFSAGGVEYTARVNGGTMDIAGGGNNFNATRGR